MYSSTISDKTQSGTTDLLSERKAGIKKLIQAEYQLEQDLFRLSQEISARTTQVKELEANRETLYQYSLQTEKLRWHMRCEIQAQDMQITKAAGRLAIVRYRYDEKLAELNNVRQNLNRLRGYTLEDFNIIREMNAAA